MKRHVFLFLTGIFFCMNLYAEMPTPPPGSPAPGAGSSLTEKEYSDAVVLLIDPKSGMIGLSWLNEETQKEEKLSFQVDPESVDVSNALNQYFEFSNISIGDHVDIITVRDASGKETVVEIVDYNAVDPDA